jgi:purine-binding chemotaxis protein CheW
MSNRNKQTAASGADSFILFELAGTTYAIRSQSVRHMEMIEDSITPVPNTPAMVEGVIFSRGQVLPALNLRARFGFEKVAHDLRTRLIVVSLEDRNIGLIVDSAREFTLIPPEAISPPGEAITGLSGRYLDGIATIGERIVLILDVNAVVDLAEMRLPAPESA